MPPPSSTSGSAPVLVVGWVAPSMAVADGTMDCDSVVVCAARWSHMASGDGMVYASGLYHGGPHVIVGRGACLVVIADVATTTEHPHQSFHARLSVLCVFSFFAFNVP